MLEPHITGDSPVTVRMSSHSSRASDRRCSSATASMNAPTSANMGTIFASDATGRTYTVQAACPLERARARRTARRIDPEVAAAGLGDYQRVDTGIVTRT